MSTLKLVIGNKNYSSWSLRPWFFLKNLNIDFEEELVFLFEDNMEERLKPYFSDSKVPVLVDYENDDLRVWDSLAIIEYIAEKFPDKQGWPTDVKARATARSISAEMHSGFNAIRNALPMNCKKHYASYSINADVQRDIDRIVNIWDFCKHNYGKNGPWLLGDFSGADAMFAPVVMCFVGYDIKLSGFAGEYMEMVLHNKHMQQWIEAGKKETQIIAIDEV